MPYFLQILSSENLAYSRFWHEYCTHTHTHTHTHTVARAYYNKFLFKINTPRIFIFGRSGDFLFKIIR